jgi:Zn-dependent alcohol dehydrogenase
MVTEAPLTFRQFIPQLIEMQRRGDFPIEKLCTFYSYKDLDQAIAAMHDGSVRIATCNKLELFVLTSHR